MSVIKKINSDLEKENALPIHFPPCCECNSPSEILLILGIGDVTFCKFHALQFSRKLLEDICEIEGDRHG